MEFSAYGCCRWENPLNGRYYLAHVKQDLLGDWVVVVCWGKVGTKLGRLKSLFCETEKKALDLLKKINRDRIRHGYLEIIYDISKPENCEKN